MNLFIEFPIDDYSLDWLWLKIFASLPLVQPIHVKDLIVTQDHDDLVNEGQRLMSGSSCITEVTFVKSGVGAKTLFQLLESIKGLKEFTYVEPIQEFNKLEPFWMRAALLAHAKQSLESLRITSSQTEEFGLLGSFRGLPILRKLETNVHFLSPRAQFDELADLLPASIEEIYLHTGDHRCCDSVSPLVETFKKAKSQLLPNLRVLELTSEPEMGTEQGGKDLIKTLEKTCPNAGIELTVISG